MFNKVEYRNLESNPALRLLVREKVMPILADELGLAADRISLAWGVGTTTPEGLPVLKLELNDDWAGRERRTFAPSDFGRDPHSARQFRWQIRDMHAKLLDDFLRKQVDLIRRNLAEASSA